MECTYSSTLGRFGHFAWHVQARVLAQSLCPCSEKLSENRNKSEQKVEEPMIMNDTYIEDLSDLNEVRVGDHLIYGAHFEHDKIIGTSSQMFRDNGLVDKFSSQDI